MIYMKRSNETVIKVLEIISMILLPLVYIGTISYESTFVVFSILAALSFRYIQKYNVTVVKYVAKRLLILSAVISFFFVVADYSIFVTGYAFDLFKGLLAFCCGTVVLYLNFCVFDQLMGYNKLRNLSTDEKNKKRGIIAAFFAPFIFDMIYLYACAYPGWVNNDTFSQILQMTKKSYTNHHPFWHTKFLEMIIMPVYKMTGDGNKAISTVCIVQIIILSLVFMYMVKTLYDINVKNKWIIVTIVAYTLLPYNAGMSCGLIKDTMFAAFVSLMVTAMYRVINDLGSTSANKRSNNDTAGTDNGESVSKMRVSADEILLIIGTLGSCLFRTNGMIAVAITVAVSWVLLYKYKRRMLIIITAAFAFAFCLNKGYMAAKNIAQPDTVESLSIPLQQIARTSFDEKDIPDKDREYLDNVIDYDRLGEVYYNIVSDSVKDEIRYNGNQDYLKEHKAEFFKVWIDIGIHHPFNYLKGWVDQTRGYWGPSYYFSISERKITENLDPSILNTSNVEHNNFFNTLFELWEKLILTNIVPSFEVIFSVGIRVWLIVFTLVFTRIYNKMNSAVCVMPLAIAFTLAIASPMCVEFRYAYAIFTAFPMVIFGGLFSVAKYQDQKNIAAIKERMKNGEPSDI